MNMIKKLKKKNWAVIAMNTMALMIIIQNVNSTCIWIDGQQRFQKKQKNLKNGRL